MQAARFFAKVFTPTGATTRRVLGADIMLSVPRIIREVNKPCGDLSLAIALPWDDFGYGDADGINLFDLVKVYAVNEANPTGVLVYQGHIEEITGTYSAGTNALSLRLFPVDALLSRSLWKSGSYAVAYAGADVDTIFSDAIDDVNTIYGATFLTKNLGNPGVSITQTFTRQTHLAAVTSAAKFLTSTWYWRMRANGQVDLAQFNDVTADHRLTVEKDVDSISAIKSLLDTKNKVVVSWGGGPTDAEYSDATSITNYGRRMSLVSDSGIGNSGSADAKGNAEVARLKDPFTKTVLVVNSNYPIETIQPGDTVKVVNISGDTSQMVSGVLRVLRVEYDGSTARLNLADVVDNFGNELAKIVG